MPGRASPGTANANGGAHCARAVARLLCLRRRLAQRWGLTRPSGSVEQTEADLKALIPQARWRDAHLQVWRPSLSSLAIGLAPGCRSTWRR